MDYSGIQGQTSSTDVCVARTISMRLFLACLELDALKEAQW